MGAIVRLSSDALEVVPGTDVSLQVTVRNTGTVVDQFAIDVLGDAAQWATVEPATLSLFPAAEGAVTIRFAAPRSSSVAAGDIPFAVRASSHEDPQGSAVEEGTLTVHAFSDLVRRAPAPDVTRESSRPTRTGDRQPRQQPPERDRRTE